MSLFDAVRSYSDLSATSFLVGLACFIALADVGCAVGLYGTVHGWAPESWGPLVILRNAWGSEVRERLRGFACSFVLSGRCRSCSLKRGFVVVVVGVAGRRKAKRWIFLLFGLPRKSIPPSRWGRLLLLLQYAGD